MDFNEFDDLIDRDLDSLSDLWAELPQPTKWVNSAEVQTDADIVLAVAKRTPKEFEGICTYSRLKFGTGLNCLRLDRAMKWLVEKGLARSVKRDIWLFKTEEAVARTELDILLDDKLLSLFSLMAAHVPDANCGTLIDCLNQISKLRPSARGVHFVP